MEKLTLLHGLNGEARREAEKIFARLAATLCELAAEESGGK
jgi:hypothetical protein